MSSQVKTAPAVKAESSAKPSQVAQKPVQNVQEKSKGDPKSVQKPAKTRDAVKSEAINADGGQLNARAFFDSQLDGERDSTISVTGAGPNFDDFEAVEKSRKETVESKVRKNNDKVPAPASKEQIEELEGDGSDKENVEEKENITEGATKEEKKEIRKMLKAMLGDENFEVPADAVMPVKINGKIENVNIQELINQYSGKVSWDKKFTELDKERKKFTGERDNLLSHFKQLQTHINSQNPENALLYLVDLVGADRHTFIKSLRDSFAPEVLKLYSMDETERAAYESQNRAQALEEKLSRLEQDRRKQYEQQQVQAKIQQLKAQSNISDDEYQAADEYLSDVVNPEERTPEFIANYIKASRAIKLTEEVAGKISESLKQNDELIKDVSEYVMKHNVPAEEVEELIRELTGINKAVAAISNKSSNLQAKAPSVNDQDEAYAKTWDEFED